MRGAASHHHATCGICGRRADGIGHAIDGRMPAVWVCNDCGPERARQVARMRDFDLYEQAVATGELPSFDMRITYMSTPLKDKFIIYQADDLMAVMMGSEPVEKMVEDLLKSYEDKGLEAMIKEVNEKAAEMGY